MKESPILFSGEMVKAILEGRKTQTRRVIDPQPSNDLKWAGWVMSVASNKDKNLGAACWTDEFPLSTKEHYAKCRYGKSGDRLWVRETYVLEYCDLELGEPEIPTDRPHFHHPGGTNEFDEEYYEFPHYRATDPTPELMYEDRDEPTCKWRPSIFMPRWASRILLDVVNVRVERLQAITREDCMAEGVRPSVDGNARDWRLDEDGAHRTYRQLWDQLNKARGFGWDMNPWVWVIEFKRMVQE
jgi:hypothetical protein